MTPWTQFAVCSLASIAAAATAQADEISTFQTGVFLSASTWGTGSDAFLIRGGGLNLDGNIMAMNDGKINSQAGDNSITNGGLAGSGTILLTTNSGIIGQLVIADTVDTTCFMGAFDLTGGGLKLAAISSANVSFRLILNGQKTVVASAVLTDERFNAVANDLIG